MSKSSLALSNLRAFVILLVVAFHSVLAYLGSQPTSPPPFDSPPYWWRAVPIIDRERWFGFDLFSAFTYVYLMQLMFFLSGLFVWPSLLRKGARKFLCDRFLRLGVPFLLGVFLLMPVALYPVYRFTAVDPSFAAFWAHWNALPFWPSGPLWFLWCLLALNCATVMLYRLAPGSIEFLARMSAKAGAYPGKYFIVLVGVSALTYMPSAAVFKPWDWVQFGPFAFQPSFALMYVVYFFAGLGVGAYGLDRGLLRSDGMLAPRWPIWLAGTLVAFLLWIIPTALTVKGQVTNVSGLEIVADFGLVLCCAAACLGWAAIFLRFGTTRRPIIDNLSESAYGIYLVHYLFITWLQYLLLGVALFAIGKAAIVFTGTLVLSWATTAAMCRVPIGGRLVGAQR
jgi:hypothetical protein